MASRDETTGSEAGEQAPRSLHQRIRSEIEAHILSGDWPPGHRIPFEHELTERYGCSRMTVSKVLTQLANAGLIERRRKAGSFVKRPVTQLAVLEIPDIKAEVSALGQPYRLEIVRRQERRGSSLDRLRLDVGAGDRILALTCRHFAGSQPFCIEDRIINLTTVPDAASETFEDEPPGTWLIHRVPWTAAEHRIKAVAADHAVAGMLAIPQGSACLAIERRTWRSEHALTHVRLTYPGDAHELVARFSPTGG